MNSGRLRVVYAFGVAFNVIALAAAANSGEYLFAVTFAIVAVYLAVRYAMVARS